MTLAEALDLLELSHAEAADIQRIRDAYARRRTQLQNQLDAAAAAPVRAAYQETLAAVDMAAAMLQTRAKLPAEPPRRSRRANTPPSKQPPAQPEAQKNGNGSAPEWIAATPWSNIRNEAGDYRPADEAASQSSPPASEARQRSEPTKPSPKAPASPVTMRLPDAVLGEAPKSEELRPIATTLGRARPEAPQSIALETAFDDGAGHSRWGTMVALVLAIGGIAGVAGWAWQAGLFEQFRQSGDGSLSQQSVQRQEQTAGANLDGAHDPQQDAGAGTDTGGPAIDPEAQRQLAQRRAEIERLGEELDRLATELGGKRTIDWQQQVAAASAAEQAGQIEDAEERLAELYDGLRAQTDAASRALVSRQRLGNAGAVEARTPIAAAASQYLQDLSRQAEVSVAEGNYTAAAQKYDRAMDARLRLPRDIEMIEPARARAADEHERALTVVAALELDADIAARLLDDATTTTTLSGGGRLIDAWLSDERAAADLVKEYEQLEASLKRVADRLEQIIELRALADASNQELARLEAEVVEGSPQGAELSLLLGNGGELSSQREAEAALRAGRLDEAVQSYKALAAEASDRLEAAVRVRELLERRTAAQERLAALLPKIREELDALEQQLGARLGGQKSEQGALWSRAVTRLAEDRAALLDFAGAATGDLPADLDSLEDQVRHTELRVGGVEALSGALAALIRAEYRLILLTQLAAGTKIEVPAEAEESLQRAREARGAFEKLLAEETPAEAQINSTAQALTEAATRVGGAADALAAPAAAKLAEMLASRQQSYRAEFGAIDLKHIWQPAEPPADFIAPAELALPVSNALSAEVETEALRQQLASGSLIEAEAVLRHVRALEEAEASLIALRTLAEEESDNGARPLHISASSNGTEQVRALLALGVSAAPRDSEGRTPLGLALAAGHLEVAALLLESGGKPTAWLEGGRPIIFITPASPGALRLLLKHGAPARDLHRGETALHALAWQANREQVPPAQQIEAARILLNAGVDRTARNRSNQTAAELASSLGLAQLAEFLQKS